MKIVVGNLVPLAALALLLPPGAALAQNIASRPGLVDRTVERVTLLPGPTLLSPARGAPRSGATVRDEPAARPSWSGPGQFTFVPAAARARGTLTLGKSEGEKRPSLPASAQRLPSPASLRFDSTLQAPPKLELSK